MRYYIILLLSCLFLSCRQSQPAVEQTHGELKAESTSDATVYLNEFFGLRLAIPDNWAIAEREELLALSKERNADVNEIKNLPLTIRYSSGEIDGASIMFGIESLPEPSVASGKDYLIAASRLLQEKPQPPRDLQFEEPKVIAGKDFASMSLIRILDGQEIKMHFWAIVEEQQAFLIIGTHSTERGGEEILALLNRIEAL